MPSLKAIRNRIASVKSTRKITSALKLVSAAKLRRAQEAIVAARPYLTAIDRVVSELSAVAGADAHKLFDQREVKKAAMVVITSDRGSAGAFNANVTKAVEKAAAGELSGATEVSLRLIGKKGNQYFSRRNALIASYDQGLSGANALTLARETANRIIADFEAGKVDKVLIAYTEFKSAISQTVRVIQVLPVIPPKVTALVPTDGHGGPGAPADGAPDFLYEPSKQALLDRLVPLYVQIQLYRAALESIASEFGARMTAMENATKNAGEMISSLTLIYNRARQASITKELLEIIGGAEALKG